MATRVKGEGPEADESDERLIVGGGRSGVRRTSRDRTAPQRATQREPYNRLRHLRHSPFG